MICLTSKVVFRTIYGLKDLQLTFLITCMSAKIKWRIYEIETWLNFYYRSKGFIKKLIYIAPLLETNQVLATVAYMMLNVF